MTRTANLLLALLAIPALGWAQGVEPEREDDAWAFGVGVYLFATNIEGVTAIGPKEIETDLTFGEALDSLEGAFTTHFEALSPIGIGFAFDYLYTKIGEDGITTNLPSVVLDNVDLASQTVELLGYYRIGHIDEGPGALDVLGGARYRSLDNNITLRIFDRPLSGDFGASWWDAVAGGRWTRRLHPRVRLSLRADAGADAFNVQGGATFELAQRILIVAQYKYLNFDHTQETDLAAFGYDATEQGALIGFGLSF